MTLAVSDPPAGECSPADVAGGLCESAALAVRDVATHAAQLDDHETLRTLLDQLEDVGKALEATRTRVTQMVADHAPRYADADQIDRISALTHRLTPQQRSQHVAGRVVGGVELLRDRRIVATHAQAAAVIDMLLGLLGGDDGAFVHVREEPF